MRELRIFNQERDELFRLMPDLVRGLLDRPWWFGDQDNFFMVNLSTGEKYNVYSVVSKGLCCLLIPAKILVDRLRRTWRQGTRSSTPVLSSKNDVSPEQEKSVPAGKPKLPFDDLKL